MKKTTLRKNGKKEITFRVDFHFDLTELARVAIRAFPSRDYMPKTQQRDSVSRGSLGTSRAQKQFEEKIRYYLFQSGCIVEDFEYSDEEVEEFMNDIKQLYPNHEW